MKQFQMMLIGGVILLLIVSANAQMTCGPDEPELPTKWIGLNGDGRLCLDAMRKQIQMEFDACIVYLAMATHFSRDVINRPGFAHMFFEAAREERVHGSRLIEYLSMRGQLTDNITNLISLSNVKEVHWESGAAALSDALKLETTVTKSIRNLIRTCEKAPNWYHLVDYLTGVFLEEQLTGQRELAGKLSTLQKMMANHGALGEFLFDEQL